MGGGGLTLVDRIRCYFSTRVCEAVYLKQRYFPLVGLSRGSLDVDEQRAVEFDVERLFFVSFR